jgi:hypothetical protein
MATIAMPMPAKAKADLNRSSLSVTDRSASRRSVTSEINTKNPRTAPPSSAMSGT